MKKINIALLVISTLFTTNIYSQDISDALRYSYITPGGTARFTSMGGSFGALGGDFSSLSINPGGIGIYRSSELSFTPSLYHNKIESSYYGTTNEDFQYDFNIHNLGGVFAFQIPGDNETPGWRSVNFGIGINRHNNFNFRRITEGVNRDYSLLTAWLEQAYAEGPPENLDNFTTGLAFDTELLYDTTGGVIQWNIDPEAGGLITKQESTVKGSIREFVLSMGGNYNDRFYIGATFGFPRVRYEEITTHKEEENEVNIPYLNSFSYKYNLKTTGTGFNFKIGAIYRVTDMIRIGAAVHTPTFYDLTEDYHTEVRSDITFSEDDRDQLYSESPKGQFDYEINTPFKAIGSLGLIFGTQGLINIDYEYVDYTATRLRSNDYSFSDENTIISNELQAQHNVRVGGELRFEPLVLRAGYAFYSNPYRPNIDNTEQSIISTGFGFRDQSYSLDFAYMLSLQSEDYYPYRADMTDPVENNHTRNGFMITLGLRF